MKFRKLFLIILVVLLMNIGISKVSAECFKICYNGKCIFSKSHSYESSDFPQLTQCLLNNARNTDVCYDQVTFTSVDRSFCLSVDQYSEGNLYSCGMLLLTDIPPLLPKIIHIIYLMVQIAVPILLVLFGSIDFIKSITSQKDDEIKKGRQTFISRLIAGVLVFFVFSIVRLIISIVNDDSSNGIGRVLDCVECFIENNDSCD